MEGQLNIFKENQKNRYKAFYNDFYKGVKERYKESMREFKNDKEAAVSISILIKNK